MSLFSFSQVWFRPGLKLKKRIFFCPAVIEAKNGRKKNKGKTVKGIKERAKCSTGLADCVQIGNSTKNILVSRFASFALQGVRPSKRTTIWLHFTRESADIRRQRKQKIAHLQDSATIVKILYVAVTRRPTETLVFSSLQSVKLRGKTKNWHSRRKVSYTMHSIYNFSMKYFLWLTYM